jgi:hypothetical protein
MKASDKFQEMSMSHNVQRIIPKLVTNPVSHQHPHNVFARNTDANLLPSLLNIHEERSVTQHETVVN